MNNKFERLNDIIQRKASVIFKKKKLFQKY